MLLVLPRGISKETNSGGSKVTDFCCRDEEIDKQLQTSSHVISWVSKQLMRDRNTGDFQNFGERLYVEALHDLERKEAEVSCGH